MITYQELIVRFSSQLGIQQSEARFALEIFAKNISQKMELGDEIEINSLGYFTLKKIKPDSGEDGEDKLIMLFSEERFSHANKNVLLFFMPDVSTVFSPSIDHYLDLSFDKPVINSGKMDEIESLHSSSAAEMIALVESKVEKLISEAVVYKHDAETDQEFILSQMVDEVSIEDETKDESISSNFEIDSAEQPELPAETFTDAQPVNSNDYELVESEKIETSGDLTSDDNEKQNWTFDDEALRKEIELQEENVELREEFSLSDEEKTESILSEDKESIKNVKKFTKCGNKS